MKNLGKSVIKSLVFSAIFLIAGNLSATVTNSLKIELEVNQKSVILSFNTTNKGEVLILLKDTNDAVLHREMVANQSIFAKKFNLKNLPAGTYYLEISDELKNVVQPLKVSVSTIEMDTSARVEFYKPVFRFQGNKLDIDFLALDTDKIDVSISNAQDQLILSEVFKTAGKPFGQRFDLSKLEDGKYSIKIKAGNQIYYKTVVIK